MELLSTSEIAEKWNVSRRRVTTLCIEGRIEGAVHKVYFILDSTYQNLKRKGIILCRVSDEKAYEKNGYANEMHLAQESLLMQYGYNVSQIEDLSSMRRQKILAILIDNKIMSKSEIISYLDFFIRQRSSDSRMEIAISKWETDREFVEEYRRGQYTKFGVKAIYRR